MKKTIHVKIGTHSQTMLVLWDDKPIDIGDVIIGMPYKTYNSLHSSVRRLKSCQYWEKFRVTDLEPVIFVDRI